MEKIRALRGFRDIYGEEIDRFGLIEATCRRYFNLLGYREMDIPVLEKTELFARSIGDTTDIVEKEMFSFIDRGGESVTVRPEATAGMVRAYLQAALYAKERMSRLFMIGPMFRHERPQKGRFRQFNQVDVEVFGMAEPILDAELIWMISLIVNSLGIKDYACEVNSVGCPGCREGFRKILVGFLKERQSLLCEDCRSRLERNPLRVFDCKNEQCIQVTQDSPLLFDSLCGDCRTHFDAVLSALKAFAVPVTVSKRLVRGLDYYTRSVFEFTSGQLGAQKAFIAGGRYDNLVEEMGGPSIPGIGFAIGMERFALLIPAIPSRRQHRYFFALIGEKAEARLLPLLKAFTGAGISLSYLPGGKSLKSQMKYAGSMDVDFVLICGENEVEKNIVLLRDMKDGSQKELPLDLEKLPSLLA